MQAEKISAYCRLHDLDLIGIIEDRGISAKNIHGRPGFQQALDAVFAGRADALVVWKLDRAFRSTQDALTVAEKLNRKGKALVSICEKLDTTSAMGEFFFTLMASLAQMERKIVGERTRAALAQKRSRGEKTGGYAPYGFMVGEHGKLVEHPEERRAIRRMKELRAKGHSYQRIAVTLTREGFFTRKGTPFRETQIIRILRHAA
jgi:site-specific DNA recombinase